MGRKQKKRGGGRRSSNKVSKIEDQAKEEKEEVWDLVHVIPKDELLVGQAT